MSSIRENPPASVVTYEQKNLFKTLYDDITENGVVLKYHDRHGLGELAVIMCEMNDLRTHLRDNGEWLKVQGDRNVIHKKNPSREALEKIRPTMMRLMKEFQMTPNSRGKQVSGIVENPSQQDGWDQV